MHDYHAGAQHAPLMLQTKLGTCRACWCPLQQLWHRPAVVDCSNYTSLSISGLLIPAQAMHALRRHDKAQYALLLQAQPVTCRVCWCPLGQSWIPPITPAWASADYSSLHRRWVARRQASTPEHRTLALWLQARLCYSLCTCAQGHATSAKLRCAVLVECASVPGLASCTLDFNLTRAGDYTLAILQGGQRVGCKPSDQVRCKHQIRVSMH